MTAAEVLSTQPVDFKTTDQSMWSSGQALSIDQQLTLFGISTGQLGFSALDGDLTVSASLGAALVADISATTGGISLDYPVNATLDAPNVVAPGQSFTVDTGADGLNGTPKFDAELPQFAAALKAVFTGGVSADFDSWLTGSLNLNVPLSNTITLASIKAGGSASVLDGLLTFSVPTDYKSQTTSTGSGSLPSVTLDAQTGNIANSSFDLLKIVTELFAPEIASYFPTGSALDGALSYNLASLILKLSAQLAQQFTFVPTGITANITAPWGQTDDVPLGQAAIFTVPVGWTQAIDLSTNYVLAGNLVSQTGLVGQVDLNLSLLSGSFAGDSFGPLYSQEFPVVSSDPIYLINPGGSGGFALDGFNTPAGDLAIALGSGSIVVPDGDTIDGSAFTANATAEIQTALTSAAGTATQTNIYRPNSQTGSAAASAGELNVEVVDHSGGVYQLPTGFQAGILEPGAGDAELDGNATDVLLAAAPSAGDTDALESQNETDSLVGGQNGTVDFVITTAFTGEIAGMTSNDTIVLSDLAYRSSYAVSLGAGNVLSIDDQFGDFSFPVATIQLHSTDDFTGETFILSADPNGGTDIGLVPEPPPPTNLKIDPSTDSSHKGTATNVSEPLIDGNGQPGYTVTLFDDGKVVGTAVVDSNGDWSVKTSKLPDGTHHFTASETAPDGAVSDPPELDLVVKATPPVAPSGLVLDSTTADVSAGNRGITAGNNLTTFTQPTIDGSGEAGDTVELLNGSTVLGTSTISSAGTWSITSTSLAPGDYSLTAISTDGANNLSPASNPLDLRVLPAATGPTGSGLYTFDADGQYVLGSAGPDDISGTTNNSVINGQTGQDTIGVQGSGNLLDSGHGNDTMSAMGNDNTLDGDKGSDNLFAQGKDNIFRGSVGPDTIFAIGDGDTITGGNTADTITVYGQNASITGAGGTDSIAVAGSNATIVGGSGDEFIDGTGGSQSITGGSAGNETIWGGTGDTIGGAGGANVTVGGVQGDNITGGTGTTFIDGDLGNQWLSGGSSGNETIWGGTGDTIAGGSGASVIIGGVPGVTITGGTGQEFIDGSLGHQSITGGSAGDETIWGGPGDTIDGGSGANVTIGGVQGDTITGGSGPVFIDGSLGNQSITAGTGSDTVWGGAGDTITGGAGPALIGFGSGAEFFNDNGTAGGNATVVGFSASSGDRILLNGGDTANTVLATASTTGGNTSISFADGSTLTLIGTTQLNNAFFR